MAEQKTFILSIEDDEVSRLILQTMFTKIMVDIEAQIWPDSVDFENKLVSLEQVPEIIIMDIKVIPIDGFQMLKIVQGLDAFKDTKIIAFTASVMPEQIKNLKKAGFDGLISKPIVRHLFPQIITSLLAGESIWYIS